MSRASQVVALVSAFAFVACTSLLGDFKSGAGGSDGGGSEGGVGDATTGDGAGPTGDGATKGDGSGATDGALDGPAADGAVCAAGQARCVGNDVETCTGGQWGASVACPTADPYCSGAGVCGACTGVCQGACTPGTTTCSTGGPQTCGSNGAWNAPTACGAHQTCTGGGSAGPATCTCAVDPTCSAAGLACEDASTLATCGQDSMGCWYPSSTAPCTNGACFGTPPNAQCCTDACTLGAVQCGGVGVQQCVAQGNGCTAWNAGTACQTNATCTAGACQCTSGFTACGSSCVDINTDDANCGGCGKACPVLASPSFGSTCGLLTAGHCAGYVGGYVSAGGSPLLSNPDGETVVAVKATMPAVAGTFVGVGALVGSNDTSGSTQMVFGLYDDSGGKPNQNLFYTEVPDNTLSFNDPSGLIRLKSDGGSYLNGFNDALAASTTYWAYMKGGTDGSSGNTAGTSTSPCSAADWINVQPPASFAAGSATCAGDYNLYMIVSFP